MIVEGDVVALDGGCLIHASDVPKLPSFSSLTQSIVTSLVGSTRSLDAVEMCLRYGAEVNAKEVQTGRMPIHWAARFGDEEIIQALVDVGERVRVRRQPKFWGSEII